MGSFCRPFSHLPCDYFIFLCIFPEYFLSNSNESQRTEEDNFISNDHLRLSVLFRVFSALGSLLGCADVRVRNGERRWISNRTLGIIAHARASDVNDFVSSSSATAAQAALTFTRRGCAVAADRRNHLGVWGPGEMLFLCCARNSSDQRSVARLSIRTHTNPSGRSDRFKSRLSGKWRAHTPNAKKTKKKKCRFSFFLSIVISAIAAAYN